MGSHRLGSRTGRQGQPWLWEVALLKYSIVKPLASPQDVCLLCFGMPSKLPYSQNFFLLLLPSRKSVSEKGGGKGAGGKRLGAAERNREVMHILAYVSFREQQVNVGETQKWGTPH